MEITQIILRLDEQDRTLRAIHDDLMHIRGQVEQTDGHVTDLRLWKARLEGAQFAVSWVPAALIAVGSSVTAVTLAHILS